MKQKLVERKSREPGADRSPKKSLGKLTGLRYQETTSRKKARPAAEMQY
jgi:hypothetical protein